MNRILIIGGGIAGKKFVKALFTSEQQYDLSLCGFGITNKTFKLSKEFSLPYIPYTDLDSQLIKFFNCVIVSVPIEPKKSIVSHVLSLGFENALMIEKPLAVLEQDCIFYQQLLFPLKRYYVCYWREFADSKVDWIRDGRVEVVYPYVFRDLRTNIIHNLPHILNWFLITTGSINEVHIFSKADNSLYGVMDGYPLSITFDNPQSAVYVLNNTVLPTLNQKDAYRKMVDSVLHFDEYASHLSIKNSIAISKILEEALTVYEN